MGVAGVSPTEEGGPQYEVTNATAYEVKPGVYLVHEIHDGDTVFRHRAVIGVAHSHWMDYSSIAMIMTVDGEIFGCCNDNWQPMFPPAFQVVSLAPSDPQPIKTLPFQPSATEPKFEESPDLEAHPVPAEITQVAELGLQADEFAKERLAFDAGVTETHPTDKGHRTTD